MAFEDFTKTTWKVVDRIGNPRCTKVPPCIITIGGTEDDVTLACSHNHRYEHGTYQTEPEMIRGQEKGYELTLNRQAPELRLQGTDKALGLGTTGTWMADDNGSEGGDR